MNSARLISFVLAILLSGCVREVDLRPYELPDLLNSFIRKVEGFEGDNALFVASDEGVMLLYGEEQVLYNANVYDELFDIEWSEAEVLYSEATDVFWVIADSTYVQLGKDVFEVHYDNTQFYAPTASYFHHVLSPAGELYRIGYYDEFWDPNSGSFFSSYFLGIYRFLGNANNTWSEVQTELTVNSRFLANPVSFFDNDGNLVIHTNPTYIVASFSQNEVVADSISKAGEGFAYRTILRPYLSPAGHVYGLQTKPTFQTPVSFVLDGELQGNTVERHEITAFCDIPEKSQGAVKLMGWDDEVAQFYIQYFTNQQSEDTDELGYVMYYDLSADDCSITPILSGPDLKWSESITDVALLGDKLYIGTRQELMVYDLQSNVIESYLLNLLDDKLVQ